MVAIDRLICSKIVIVVLIDTDVDFHMTSLINPAFSYSFLNVNALSTYEEVFIQSC